MMASLKAGAGKTKITLAPGGPMAGYAARNGRSIGIHDPLYARMVLLDGKTTQYALVVLDLLKVDENLVALIRREINNITGIPRDSITVAATHTHSGPAEIGNNPEFATSIAHDIAGLARKVWADRVPATIGMETGELHDLGRNRNHPDGLYDPAVGVIRIDSFDGQVLAIIINYACHPTVLGEDNLLFSRDFPGFAVDLIEKESTDGTPVAIFTNGAAGDISTRYTRKESTFTEAKRFGELLARKVLEISHTLTTSFEWRIDTYRKEISLPIRQGSIPFAIKTLSDARRKLSDLESKPVSPGEIRTAQTTVQAAEMVLKKLVNESQALNEAHTATRLRPGSLLAEIQVVFLTGETKAAIIVLPGEIPCGVGQWFKRIINEMGGVNTNQIVIFGYGNGHIGYLPSPESYQKLEYESLMSKVDPGATELIAETLRTLGEKGSMKNAGEKIF